MGARRGDGAALYVWADVIEELVYAALHAPHTRQAALLLGGAWQGPNGDFVEVRGFSSLMKGDVDADFATELADDWRLLNNRASRIGEGMGVVGWATMREGISGRLASSVQMLHRSFFNLPFEVMLALDSVDKTVGAWAVDRSGYLINVGFNLVSRRGRDNGGERNGNH